MSPPPSGQGPIDPSGLHRPPQPPPVGGAPAYPYPPPWMMKPKSSAGWIIITIILIVLLLGSLLMNFMLAAFAAGGEGSGVQQNVLQSGTTTQTVAVVPIKGVIMDATYTEVKRTLDQLETNSNIKAIVLEVDTPGGGVTASDLIYQRLLKLKQNRNIPIVVSMGSMATSGGYYVSCAADEIVAQPTTLTGNIGVILPRFNLSEMGEKIGLQDATIVSSGTPFKDAGSMWSPESEQDRAYLQGLIDAANKVFRGVVTAGRSTQLKQANQTVEAVADGRAFDAATAIKLGLVDTSGYLDDAVAAAATRAGLTTPHVVRYDPPPTLIELFGLSQGPDGSMRVSLNKRVLDASIPRPMYLWLGR